jgi:hypothetical protein
VTTAKTDLRAGETIDALGGYMTYGQCETYDASRAENLLPIGLAEGCRLRRDVPKDAVLTYQDVEIPPGRLIDKLRAEQDALFPPGATFPGHPGRPAAMPGNRRPGSPLPGADRPAAVSDSPRAAERVR